MCQEMLSQPRTGATRALEGGTLGGKQSKSAWGRRMGDPLPEGNGLVDSRVKFSASPSENVIKDVFWDFMTLLSI